MFYFKVIVVHEISDADVSEDYLIGERGNQKGKVPKAFLELLTYWADRTDGKWRKVFPSNVTV